MTDLTIIYYTSNRESPVFEEKIRANIVAQCGGAPIISVSHQPITFGKNICVGDVGLSSHNCRRQFQIGVVEAKTAFVCAAESDFLYPPEYFSYHPDTSDSIHCPENLYIFWPKTTRSFFRKVMSDGAIIMGRDYALKLLDTMLSDRPLWCSVEDKPKKGSLSLTRNSKLNFFPNAIPVITFKTGNGLHNASPISGNKAIKTLAFWGSASALRRQYVP